MPAERVEQILAADGAARLPRRPRGEGAPVGGAARARPHRRRQIRVALGDFEIPEHRIVPGGHAFDLVDTRSRSDLSHEASCGSRSYAGLSRSEPFAEI